tara:strand:+ start:687 stop:1472 length:786 start_codon:yes stop_codon:yes gene_type:complete
MLGLSNSLISGLTAGESPWTPETPTNLAVWLKFNTNITSDEGDGSSYPHSTVAGTMVDGDKINAWNAFGSTSVNSTQTTSADKPRWETDSADLGAVNFVAAIKYMDFSSDITIAADTDFSIVMRIKPGSFAKTLLGSSAGEFLKLQDNKTIRLFIDNVGIDFEEASDTFATDTYYTIVFSRTNGSTGDLNVYVNGGAYSDKDWDAAENTTDSKDFVISNLGAKEDDSNNFQGFMKDVIIYNGTALTDSNRSELYTYLEGQE